MSDDKKLSKENNGVFWDDGVKKSKHTIINKDMYNKMKMNNPSDKKMKALMLSYNLANRYSSETNWYSKFNRFGMLDAHNAMSPTRQYLFFTRPDLHLVEPDTYATATWIKNTSSYLKDAVERYPRVAQQLQLSNKDNNNNKLGSYPFAPLLSNALAPDSFLDMPDLSSDIIDTASNSYGTKMFYRGSSLKSDEEFDFSLEFIDSKYLDVYTYFKIFDEYERHKWLGQVDNTVSPWNGYAENRVLHDAFSIYKFVVADDGMTLVYWARATGVIPTSVPRSALSDLGSSGDGQKISISFKAHFVRDMDPRIIYDFNKLNDTGRNKSNTEIPLTYKDNSGNIYSNVTNGEWAMRPYIDSVSPKSVGYAPKRKYFLSWKK